MAILHFEAELKIYICRTFKILEDWFPSDGYSHFFFSGRQSSHESLYIIRRFVFGTFTDKGGITNPLNIVLKTLSSEAGVTNIEITLFTVVFRVLINHVGIVVFVLSYLRAAREGSVVLSEEDLGHTGNIGD